MIKIIIPCDFEEGAIELADVINTNTSCYAEVRGTDVWVFNK